VDRLIALVGLRWRMDLRALLRRRERLLGLLFVLPGLLLFSGIGSLLALFGVATLERWQPDAVLPLVSALSTLVGIGWLVSPLVAGVAWSETHDMTRLLHFPVPLATLAASSLLANLLQPMVLAEAPILLCLALATGGAGGFPLALLGVGLSFALILAVSQVLGLLVHGLSRNRRAHDLALSLGLLLGGGLTLLPIFLLLSGPGGLGRVLGFLVDGDLFAWSPFAWGVRAAVHAGRGEGLAYAVSILAAVLALLATLGLSTVLIQWVYRGELRLGPATPPTPATPARMWLRGPLGALVEKDLRAAWRDPALKTTLFMSLLGPLLLLALLSRGGAEPASVTALLLLAAFVGLAGLGGNAFGLERRGVLLLLGFPMDRFWLLLGKNLAVLVLRAPGLLVLLAAAAGAAPVALLPAVAVVALATLLISLAADNYLSILFPMAAPAPGKSPGAGGSRGFAALGATAVLVPVILVVAGPFVFLSWLPLLLGRPWLWLLSLPLALAGAAASYALLTAGAARLLAAREPELLERILEEV